MVKKREKGTRAGSFRRNVKGRLQREITERKRANENLRESEARFQELFNEAPVGYHEYDTEGRFTQVNRTELKMLGYSLEEMIGQPVWNFVEEREEAERSIRAKLAGTIPLSQHLERVYRRKDGTAFPALIQNRILRDSRDRITGIRSTLQDISERKQAEAEAKRLAHEDAVLAEIGRIISSTLNIEEVYKFFSEKVRELIRFDRIAIGLIDAEETVVRFPFIEGLIVPGREPGDVVPLAGTAMEKALRARAGIIFRMEREEEVAAVSPGLLPEFRCGLRSALTVPLISEDRVIGTLALRSTIPGIYTERDLRLAENIGNQIAGAIANAQIYIKLSKTGEDLRRSEENARRLADENAVMAEIGRIANSSLNIEEAYEGFGEEVKKIIPFDRIVINTIDPEKSSVKNVYIAGEEVPDRRVEEIYPLEGSGNAEMVRTKSTLLIQTEDFSEYKDRFPMLLSTFQAGFRSILNVPLFSKGEIIGGLLLRSRKPYAYTDKDVRVAEKIGSQIAGAIANAQLYAERIHAEREKASLEEQLRQAQKMEAIGRLAGGIAHDFNNLLTVINGYIHLSLRDLNPEDPLTGNIQQIQKAANRASALTHQLLAFGRRQILELKVLDLNGILRGMEKMLHRVIREDIEVITLQGEDLGKVRTDPGQVEQVILNLAVNGSDAMPKGGKLVLETGNVDLDEEYARSHVAVKTRALCKTFGKRYGDRDDAGGERASIRALLYDEGSGKGDGFGVIDGLWNCQAERRKYLGV